jgi:hypothetical protein
MTIQKPLKVEVTDLTKGLTFHFGEENLAEFDKLSETAQIDSILFGDLLVSNHIILDRKSHDLKQLCELYLAHDETTANVQFNGVILAYALNTGLTADEAYDFVSEKLKLELHESEIQGKFTTPVKILANKEPGYLHLDQLISSKIGSYHYLFEPTHC